jgi:hypothetical protein
LIPGNTAGAAELYSEMAPHTATRPCGRNTFIAAVKCMPPTFSKYISMPPGATAVKAAVRASASGKGKGKGKETDVDQS